MELTDVVVRDGSTVCVRRATADDLDALAQFFRTLSSESSQRLRYPASEPLARPRG